MWDAEVELDLCMHHDQITSRVDRGLLEKSKQACSEKASFEALQR